MTETYLPFSPGTDTGASSFPLAFLGRVEEMASNVGAPLRWDDRSNATVSSWSLHGIPPEVSDVGGHQNFSQYFRELEVLRTLPEDWHAEGVMPPNRVALSFAREALEILKAINFLPLQVTASVEEGVGIAFVMQEKYADIEFFNSGEILAVISSRQKQPDVWAVGAEKNDIQHALGKIRDYLLS